MTDPERVEKMRQAVMRLHELLDHLRSRLAAGDRAYERLFASFDPAAMSSTPHKEMQRQAALLLLENPRPLQDAVLQLRFDARDLEHAFEELYNNTVDEDDEG
jgi:uncharacterized membrane protein